MLHSIKSDNRRAVDIIVKLRILFEQDEGLKELLDIKALIEDCAAIVRARAEEADIDMQLDIPSPIELQAGRS